MIQSVINFIYRYPKGEIKRFNHFGGYWNYRKMVKGRKEMECASLNLKPVSSHPEGLLIHFLTGKKFLYQTLFCIHSLTKVTKTKFRFILVDDGSIDAGMITRINSQLPGAEIITRTMIDQNLKESLPKQQYPFLHEKRRVYPHIKKLTDIHTLPFKGWKLVLDSDMLFWNEPTEIIDWLQKSDSPLHMIDCIESYGYSKSLMENLSNNTIPSLVNVGAIGLHSSQIKWNQIEAWAKTLEDTESASYYLEQALTAMIIGSTPALVLDANRYVVNPSEKSISNKSGVLHHFVDLSKEGYFKKAWRTI